MRSSFVLIFGLGALAGAVALAGGPGAAGAAPEATLTVHRGAVLESLNLDASGAVAAAGVQTVRGETLAPPVRPGPPAPAPVEALAGQRIWFVDRGENRLTACNLRSTTEFGRRIIRCRSRPLPD